jgi:FkbM family methyltransferase
LLLTLNLRFETELWQGNYESSVQATLASLVGPGKVLYDVGGGIGFYSLLAAKLGATALVFEPDAYNAQCIRRNAEMNRLLSNIQVIECAAFSHTGHIFLEPATQDRGHGNAHVMADDRGSLPLRTIPCVRPDDFVCDHPAPHVVKIDVEGAESDVLQGAQILFANFRPHLICEVHDSPNSQFIEQWTARMGYGLRWLEPCGSFPIHVLCSPE